MADNTIDTLSIKISSDSRTASASIERLASALMGLNKAVGRGTSGLNSISNAITSLVSSASGAQGLDNIASSIQKLALSMQRLSNINI